MSCHLAVLNTAARCSTLCRMTVAEEKRLNELEAQQSLLAKQVDALQKQLGGSAPAADVEDVEQPLAEYARNFYVTILLCVLECAAMVGAAFSPLGIYGNLSQVCHFSWAMCWTTLFVLIFGTMDSVEAGRRAIQLLRAFASIQIITEPLMFWSGGRYAEAALQIFAQGINAVCYPWLCRLMLELFRERGSLASQAEHYTNRGSKVAGLQLLVAVGAAAMGVDGPRT